MPGDRPPTSCLQAALEAQRAARADELGDLLEQIRRIDAWLRGPLPDDLAAHLTANRARLASAVADLLVQWLDAGGGIEFAGVDLDELVDATEAADADLVDEDDDDEVTAESLPRPVDAGEAEPPRDAAPEAPPIPAPAEPLAAGPAAWPPSAPTPRTRPATARPATVVSVEALKRHLAGGGNFAAGLAPPDWQTRLAAVVDELADAQDSADEVGGLVAAVDGAATWTGMGTDAHNAVVSWLVAKLRSLQVAHGHDSRVDAAFRDLTHHQRVHQPGFVYGLARDHRPKHGSWSADAAKLWDALLEYLPEEEEPDPPSLARPVRAPAPSRARPEPAGEDDDRPDPIPADWPWSRWTRGKRAVMVGGDPREPNRVRLEAAFGFAELTWEQAEFSRNPLQKVRERVRSGRLDMVIVLSRFVGHDADQVIQPACKEYGVPFVPVPTGYGTVAIRMAIERHLPGDVPDAQSAADSG